MDSPVVTTLVELLRIESITGNERSACDYVAGRLGESKQLTQQRIGNSIVATPPHQSGRPTLGLFGHLDTVPGTEVGAHVKIEAGNVYGLGASDMKGGVAVMLELLRQEIWTNSPYNLQFVFYEAEEGPYENNGLHKVMQRCPELKNINLAFMLEPTENDLHLGSMGIVNARTVFRGKRAHSARPWLGENAVYKSIPALSRIAARQPKLVKRGQLEFREVMTLTEAKAGIAVNVVPDAFEVNVNIRIGPGTSMQQAQAEYLDLVHGEAEVSFYGEHPSGEVCTDNPLLKKFQELHELNQFAKQAYTDVALLGVHGVPAVNCGPGLTAQAHQRGEFVPVENLERALEIYTMYLS